jgi:hypothetical protein
MDERMAQLQAENTKLKAEHEQATTKLKADLATEEEKVESLTKRVAQLTNRLQAERKASSSPSPPSDAGHTATRPDGPGSSAGSTRPLTAGRQIVRRPRGHVSSGLGSNEIYDEDEEEPQYCNCVPGGSEHEQFRFPRGGRFCALCGENRPMLEEVQKQFMNDAAAAAAGEGEDDDDLLRLFLLRRDHVIELAKNAADAQARGVQPDPLPVCQVITHSCIRHTSLTDDCK